MTAYGYLIFAASLILQVIEVSLLRNAAAVATSKHDFFLTTIPATAACFMCLISKPDRFGTTLLTTIGKRFSADIYIYHKLTIAFVSVLVSSIPAFYSCLYYLSPLLIFIMTLVATAVVRQALWRR